MARRFGILFLVLVTASLALIAYWMLFTTFMGHDDEGYVLISLKNYSAQGGLYSHVYSQYGPFFYFFHDLGHRLLRYEFTNTNGRFITLISWLGAATACAHLVWRQTRAITLTVFTLGLTFFHLWLMVSEPIHPGGLISLMVALGAWWGARQIVRGAMINLALSAALAGTALLLIKINVGGFFLAAAGSWFAIHHRDERAACITTTIAATFLIVLPVVLMWSAIAEPWARTFATLASAASAGMLAAAWKERQPVSSWRDAGLGAGTAVLFGALVVFAVCLRGSSFPQIMEGMLWAPLRHPGIYHYPPDWKPAAVIVSGISILLAVVVWRSRPASITWVLVAIRLLVVIEFSLASLEWLPFSSHSSVMSYAVPLAWIFVLRLNPDRAGAQRSIAPWIGLLLVLQYLHAYPVAGSQIAWGTFLIVPLMALGLHDTQRFLAQQKYSRLPVAVGTFSLVVALIAIGRLGQIGWDRYSADRPLQLAGADDIRVPENYASTLRTLSLNAAAHGDMLFSLPGMYSFNLWTDLPTPSQANTTHWFSLLSQKQQEEISTALDQSKRPVLIIHRGLLEFLTDSHFIVSSPLNDYLQKKFVRVFVLGKYEFRVRRGRTVASLSTAEFLQLSTAQSGMAPNRLQLIVAIPPGRKVARIELVDLESGPKTLKQWDRTSGPLLSTAITLGGAAIGAESDSSWETTLPALVRLDLPLAQTVNIVRRNTVVYLRDRDGSITAEARFVE